MLDDYELHEVDRDDLNEGRIWVRNETDPRLKKIEGRRSVVRFQYRDPKGYRKRICSETLYAEEIYLRNRRSPILIGEITNFVSKADFWVKYRRGPGATRIFPCTNPLRGIFPVGE